MELINNTTKTLKDDLSVEIKQGSKVSIAAACFSIYAFQELKEQLSQIEQLRFIFTSPTFVTEKAKKERREFYIPRMTRERSLYGTEFEIKLRNELTQKAIARECAEWIRQKVTFKSNISDKSIQGQIVVDGVGYTPINNFTTVELGCEKGNVISTTIVKDESLARTLLADFNEIWNDSKVLQVVTDEVIEIYVLKNRSNSVNIDNQNRLHPFYMVYIGNDGEVICDHLSPKQMLDKMRFLCKGKTEPIPEAYKPFNKETRDGRNMSQLSKLLGDAIASIIEVKDESDIDSFLGGGQVSFLSNEIKGLDDFELICFLVVR